jgi:hypothetical protein
MGTASGGSAWCWPSHADQRQPDCCDRARPQSRCCHTKSKRLRESWGRDRRPFWLLTTSLFDFTIDLTSPHKRDGIAVVRRPVGNASNLLLPPTCLAAYKVDPSLLSSTTVTNPFQFKYHSNTTDHSFFMTVDQPRAPTRW